MLQNLEYQLFYKAWSDALVLVNMGGRLGDWM